MATQTNQLELEIPVEYKDRFDYKKAIADQRHLSWNKSMQPSHIVFDKNRKTFYCTFIFSEDFIKSEYPSLIIIKP